jgi:hypothetical protein
VTHGVAGGHHVAVIHRIATNLQGTGADPRSEVQSVDDHEAFIAEPWLAATTPDSGPGSGFAGIPSTKRSRGATARTGGRRARLAYGGDMQSRSVALAALAIVGIAACTVAPGGSPASLPSLTPDPNQVALASRSPAVSPSAVPIPSTVTPTVAPTPSPVVAPGDSAVATPLVEPSGTPHVDPELEAMLPTLLSGTPLFRTSMHGSVFTAGSDMCLLICGDEPYRYAKELGVDIDDITIAFAISDSLGIGMIAYRARGAKADRLIPARIAIGGYTGHGGLYDLPVKVAGRSATYLDGGMGESGEYLLQRHGVLFIVLGAAPSKGSCHPGFCASPPPGPWTAPDYVVDALGGVP